MSLFSKAKSALVAAGLLIGLATGADANVIKSFNVWGEFEYGGTLSGKLSIDVTDGKAVAADILVTGIGGFTTSTILNQYASAAFATYSIILAAGANDFGIILPTISLVDYAGGPIVSLQAMACVPDLYCVVTGYFEPTNYLVFLEHGAVTEAAAPEPLTLALLGGGLLGIAAIRRRHAV